MENRNRKLSEIGEKKAIYDIISKYISKPVYGEYLYFPEDCRDIYPIAPRILFSIDGYSIKSAKLPWRTLSDIGWCAVVNAISDHVCKGGLPRDIVVSIGLTGENTIGDLEDLMNGIEDAVKTYRLRLLGGDLNVTADPWINVAVLSYTSIKKPPRRCCGKLGDLIIATGIYGAMGFLSIHGLEESMSIKWIVENTRRPIVYLETAFIISQYYRFINASMDSSDGLGYTLLELSRLSNKGILLKNHPRYYSELDKICGSEECIWKYVLNGGEEYGSVIVIQEEYVNRVVDYLNKLRIPHEVIGKFIDKPPHLYYGDTILDDYVKQWDQFKGWIQRTTII
ncbi:MAG: AIR synthase related protein [Desulfurococcaceae archaeon]